MSVKSLKNILAHIAAWAVIFCLLLLIWRFKSNEFDHVIAQDLDELCPVALERLRSYNMQLKEDIVKNSIDYQNPTNDLYAQRACRLYAHADSLMFIPTQSEILTDFDHLLTEVTDSNVYTINMLNIEMPEIYGKKHTHFSKADLLLTQLQIATMESVAMQYFHDKVVGITIRCFGHEDPVISFTDFGQTKGDTVHAEVVASTYMLDAYAEMRLKLDSRELTFKEGVAHFERVFPKPGIYPLKASISVRKMRSDSLCTWEKTFYLKVQE
jgi:hypothetical protein